MKRVLIHGYSRGVNSLFHKRDEHVAGFGAYQSEISNSRSQVFFLAKPIYLSVLSSFNVWRYFKLYFSERSLVAHEETLQRLDLQLKKLQPEQIVCHSLGCFLSSRFVMKYSLPSSVQSVVFLQADCSEAELVESGLLNLELQFVNVYRWLDPALVFGSIMHGKLRIGLKKIIHAKAKNVYFPSLAHPNFHDAALYDKHSKSLI